MILSFAGRLTGCAPGCELRRLALARGPLPSCFGLLAKRRNVLPLDSLFRPLCALGDVMRRTILQFACVCRILTFICDPFALVRQGFSAISGAGSQR